MQHNFTCVSKCIGKLSGLWQTWLKSFIILNSPQPTFPITPLTGGSPTLSINLDLVVLQWHEWEHHPVLGEGSGMCLTSNFSQENMYTHFDDVMRVFPQRNLQTSIQLVITVIVM